MAGSISSVVCVTHGYVNQSPEAATDAGHKVKWTPQWPGKLCGAVLMLKVSQRHWWPETRQCASEEDPRVQWRSLLFRFWHKSFLQHRKNIRKWTILASSLCKWRGLNVSYLTWATYRLHFMCVCVGLRDLKCDIVFVYLFYGLKAFTAGVQLNVPVLGRMEVNRRSVYFV